MVDSPLAQLFQPYLRAGERVVWAGRPAAGIVLAPSDVFAVPFSFIWAGTVAFIFGKGAFLGAAFFPFNLMGVLFVAVGIYVTIGRFLHDAWGRSRMAYALTDQRALVLRRLFSETLLSANLGNVSVRRGRDGRGTLDFDRKATLGVWSGPGWSRGFSTWTPSLTNQVRFVQIPNVMDVYALAERSAAARPTP